jgi:hypothetical protein
LEERRRNEKQMVDFREVLSYCDLYDLGYSGSPWTFDNKQWGTRNVKVRLDRAVACLRWTDIFPDYLVSHLTSPRSDHCPILIELFKRPAVRLSPPIRRYEACWEMEHSLAEEIEIAWTMHKAPKDLGDIAANLSGVMGSLQAWSAKTVGSVPKRIDTLRRELARLNARHDTESQRDKRKVEKEMDSLLEKEEIYWKQRSRIEWLREGDRNTKFFHRKATWRKKKNTISKLKKDDGTYTDNVKEMGELTTKFFEDLYTADCDVEPEIIQNILEPQINQQMNEDLCKEFSEEEISNALFQIGPLKAPGADGFPARFFQRNWATLKEDVIRAVKEFFATGNMPDGVNDTIIVLIPKAQNPESLREFRPISLCNVIYKVVSKCLVNRLRPLLENIILPTQSAFIPGRLITDNTLIAFECIHAIHKNKDNRGKYCAYKLDLAKAYDRVDWSYLEGTLRKFGFTKAWIRWVMSCVKSVTYSVRLNGDLLKKFRPSRGL